LITKLIHSECRQVIVWGSFVSLFCVAHRASMQNHPSFLPILIEKDWLHEPLALGRPIPRPLQVHVLAPETYRTMVPARTMLKRENTHSTLLTIERFLAGNKHHIKM